MAEPIMIVGGGIGGLSAAIVLQQRDIEAHVYEAAPELRPVGAGIWVPANAMQVLSRLGLAEAVSAAGVPLERVEITDSSGALLQGVDFAPYRERFGETTVAIHRAELQRILASHLAPGTLHLGRQAAGYSRTDSGTAAIVRFRDGSEATGPALIGADGIRSAIRKQMQPSVSLRYSGQTCWRGTAAMVLRSRIDADISREIWGPSCRFGFSAVSASQVYWYATMDAPPGGIDEPGSAKPKLQTAFREFPPPVGEILICTPEESIVRTDLNDFLPLPTWSDGNVTLLGDAAHAMTPNLGQGGAQSIEDAWVIGDCLARRPADTAAAFQEYERRRKPRTSRISRTAWQIGRTAHLNGSVARRLRDFAIRHTPAALTNRQFEELYRLNL